MTNKTTIFQSAFHKYHSPASNQTLHWLIYLFPFKCFGVFTTKEMGECKEQKQNAAKHLENIHESTLLNIRNACLERHRYA